MIKGLSNAAIDFNYAIESLREEVEAVNDYNQRAEVVTDPELKKILLHHRDEEMEHSAMLIEWIRRNQATFGKEIEEYLFAQGSIVSKEESVTGSSGENQEREVFSLNIGSLK